jgi:hypothetical protein
MLVDSALAMFFEITSMRVRSAESAEDEMRMPEKRLLIPLMVRCFRVPATS